MRECLDRSLPVCRDRGWMTWQGGGLVPVPRRYMIRPSFAMQTDRLRTRDRHKAPASTLPFPPVPTDGKRRSERFPDSVINIHQDGGGVCNGAGVPLRSIL